ncbi:MAG: helix-turn-helix transcriptional regulator, partial [Chloroflexota bacterium]|nr:helix-turn-helix transcriptional regulator [Chloroflexota bacterium]
AGLSQDALASAVGVSKSEVSRIERDEAPWLTVVQASTLLSVVGLELGARAYPAGSPLRDRGHLRLLADFEARLSPGVGRVREWAIPIPGDPRAVDLVLTRLPVRIGVEAETVLDDLQALERRMRGKQRDGQLGRMILLVRGSHRNREILAGADALQQAFPRKTRAVMGALARGADPGGDGIVLL